jgi:hypothetical protein
MLRARRFQLELERGDRLQRIVDLEAEVHTRRSSRVSLVWIRRARLDRRYRLHQIHLRAVVLQLVTRMPVNDIKKQCAPRCHLRDDCGSQLRSMPSCNAIAL